jgi:hypothetical protein
MQYQVGVCALRHGYPGLASELLVPLSKFSARQGPEAVGEWLTGLAHVCQGEAALQNMEYYTAQDELAHAVVLLSSVSAKIENTQDNLVAPSYLCMQRQKRVVELRLAFLELVAEVDGYLQEGVYLDTDAAGGGGEGHVLSQDHLDDLLTLHADLVACAQHSDLAAYPGARSVLEGMAFVCSLLYHLSTGTPWSEWTHHDDDGGALGDMCRTVQGQLSGSGGDGRMHDDDNTAPRATRVAQALAALMSVPVPTVIFLSFKHLAL